MPSRSRILPDDRHLAHVPTPSLLGAPHDLEAHPLAVFRVSLIALAGNLVAVIGLAIAVIGAVNCSGFLRRLSTLTLGCEFSLTLLTARTLRSADAQ